MATAQPARGDLLAQFPGLGEIIAQRFLHHDIEPGRHRKLQICCMAVIRRNDRKRLDAIVATTFLCDQFLDAAVAPRLGQACRHAFGARSLRPGRQHPGDEGKTLVHGRGHPMHRTDHGRRRAADDAETKRPPEGRQYGVGHSFLAIPSTWSNLSGDIDASSAASNDRSERRMMCWSMKRAPSRAPSFEFFRQHSHSSTAQPS